MELIWHYILISNKNKKGITPYINNNDAAKLQITPINITIATIFWTSIFFFFFFAILSLPVSIIPLKNEKRNIFKITSYLLLEVKHERNKGQAKSKNEKK